MKIVKIEDTSTSHHQAGSINKPIQNIKSSRYIEIVDKIPNNDI